MDAIVVEEGSVIPQGSYIRDVTIDGDEIIGLWPSSEGSYQVTIPHIHCVIIN